MDRGVQQKKFFNEKKFDDVCKNTEARAELISFIQVNKIYEQYFYPLQILEAGLSAVALKRLYQEFSELPEFNPKLKKVEDILKWIFDNGYQCYQEAVRKQIDLQIFKEQFQTRQRGDSQSN
ncbi:hypothetical protein TVAG_222430 [Trichomonas vaginalis G3]|uniref:Uncharacterized protein n=1 Tax=Trichomonas vaginalis (strain ATCC PRA-98 / G3) TaxID=412133 RepID=A2F5B9_TRIV3|nr:hypothetical protein TVAGG3_1032060 [Trichomonas vaginalis G3]EAX99882.1 hypothetical protein TVAG_222430 [Trichomonas vaginalis G3]KAI5492938.1 hypothetical protein TVAGG3_1032060 [Trichomonas vaginalis G3]|eukprot:XP_001312812.1 hypothetical protein [Trichomonas vaginalis G3]